MSKRKPLWFGKLSQRKNDFICSFVDFVPQDEPTEFDEEAVTRPPIDIRAERFSNEGAENICFIIEHSRTEIRNRVKELKRAFSLVRKFTPSGDSDEPSIFHKTEFSQSICRFQETDQKGREEYALVELEERKKNDLARYEPERVPDHIRHWILTGEGVPTI